MKQLRLILIPIVLAYLTIVALYVGFQRSLIFHPTPSSGVTPKFYSLDYQDVYFPSSDGVTLNGWCIQHPRSGKKRPFLLYCHANGDNLSDLANVTRLFYDDGFDMFFFDYRSYGNSQKAPVSEAALDRDALSAYQWVKAKGISDDRIILWGHSLGSSVAAWLATQTHPAGLIFEGAFPSIYDVNRQRNPWLLVLPFMIKDKFQTASYVQQRTCPLLEFHAELDTIIPIQLGQKVFEKAAEPKQWVVVKGINHNDFPSVANQYKPIIQAFVEKCLVGKEL